VFRYLHRAVIDDLNPILRGWGNDFRTGDAAKKTAQVDRYVVRRLRSLQVRTRGRNLRPRQMERWPEDWFNEWSLYRLRRTVGFPRAA
jgi:RNA-directed DNA polymerase